MQIQVKIIIGTLAFMLTMVLLGFVALREPARLESTTLAIAGRSVENGAELFQNNCTTCHGINGRAEVGCIDENNDPSENCRGLPLNDNLLLCGSPSARMTAMGWVGTKEDFIRSTLWSGRPWSGMPTWGEEFGGPLVYYQIDQLTAYILNWEGDVCEGPGGVEFTDWPTSVADLPAGDAANGATLYDRNCARCHGNVDEPGSNQVGPWLGDVAATSGDRVDGYSSADYIYESILNVNAYISPDWDACAGADPCAVPSTMQATFGLQFNEQDMADLLVYLIGSDTLETAGAEVVFEGP